MAALCDSRAERNEIKSAIRLLTIVFLALVTSGCNTASMSEQSLPPNYLPAEPDYYELVVEPDIQIPLGQGSCELRNVERDFWLGWARDAWLGANEYTLYMDVDVSYGGPSGAVSYAMPVFLYKKAAFSSSCEIESNSARFQSSLFRMDNTTSFSVKIRTSAQSELDTTVFRVGTEAALALARWNGVPEYLASALGATASIGIDNIGPDTFSVISNEQIGLANGLNHEAAAMVPELRTAAGSINVTVRAYLSPVASAVKPYPNAVPDFSRLPVQYALSWNIGDQILPSAVDLATDGKWSHYMDESDVSKLESICRDVQRDLVVSGFSASDASILAWIMTKVHPDSGAVQLMAHPDCLRQRQHELARFGVTTNELVSPGATTSNQAAKTEAGIR